MKQELKRIEAALHKLSDQPSGVSTVPLPLRRPPARLSLEPAPEPKTKKASPKVDLPSFPALPDPKKQTTATAIAEPVHAEPTVESLSTTLSEVKVPALPRLKTPSFSNHRNAANPTIAMNLLKEMETTVAGWQEELQQTLRQIQDLYMEGPIVDGWLESYAQQEGEAPEFRHADVDCLIDYIEKMRSSTPQDLEKVTQTQELKLPQEINAAGYRLCGLNEDGQLWFRHCPPEQVPAVGMAIARYQRLRLLLSRKQTLETRLGQLAETLVMVHGKMNG